MTIDTILYNLEGNIISGVYAWPKGRPEDQAFVIGNGELIMSNLQPNDIIVFSFQGNKIEIPANQIDSELYLDFTDSLSTVDLGEVNKSKSNLGVWLSLLAFGGLVTWAVTDNNTQKVSM